jgi:hypothetical protein
VLCAFGGALAPDHFDSALVVYAEGDSRGLTGSGDVTEWLGVQAKTDSCDNGDVPSFQEGYYPR